MRQAAGIVAGSVCLGAGVIGIFVPLLPTTPFLLLAAALYMRSSPRLYAWLLANRYLGTYIRNYRERKALPRRVKVFTLALMWTSSLWCIVVPLAPWLWAQVALGAVAVGVTWHLLSFATLRRE